ncbi:MAG: hypothetical protein V4449_03660 [Patescibacteria group bacterium]
MKKGTWIVLGIGILVATGAFVITKQAEAPTVGTDVQTTSPSELLKGANFTVPDSDVSVSLVNGEATFPNGNILLLDTLTAEWKKDERKDLVAVFAVNTGGTASFLYLVLFDVNGDILTKKSEGFLGDRINITHVGIGELVHGGADYRVTVQTLERKENEPFSATPSVEKTRTFYVTDQKLEEIEVGRDDT